MLISLEGAHFKHAIRLDFAATNNVVKYEAFLVGLHLITEVAAKKLLVHIDSQLVAGQVSQNFEAQLVVLA